MCVKMFDRLFRLLFKYPLLVFEQGDLSWGISRTGLVAVLDETGTFLGAANWLKWLCWEGRSFEDRAGVARRLAVLVERLERWRW